MRGVRIWLWAGAIMTLIQVMLGGITRLTGSGLSITEWDVLVGSVPPLNEQQWNEAFDKYKQFPQYKLVNQDMELSSFKKIFFWEYMHRNWARLIGLVFIIPFLYFLMKKKFNRQWTVKLLILMVLGGLQGLVGWLMVASGLIDKPWVSPYNLTLHLMLALLVYLYILWLIFSLNDVKPEADHPVIHKGIKWVIGFVLLQIVFGGFMAGTKAGLTYNTYPLMDGRIFPENFFIFPSLLANIFENQAAINFIHRTLAAIVVISIALLFTRNIRYASREMRRAMLWLLIMICIQFTLGLLTLFSGSSGEISVWLGVMHQMGAFITASVCLYILYYAKRRSMPASEAHPIAA